MREAPYCLIDSKTVVVLHEVLVPRNTSRVSSKSHSTSSNTVIFFLNLEGSENVA